MTTTMFQPDTDPPVADQPLSDQPATRSQNDTLKALPTTLKSEWIKLSTIRSNKAIVVLTIALNGLVSWAVANFVTEQGELFVDEVFAFSTVFTAVFAAVAGILIFSSEAQHGTLAPTLTAQPARLAIATAKTLTAAAFGAVLGAAGLIAGIAGASIAGIETGDTSTIVDTSLWAVLFVSLASILGLGVGMIARHSTAAISGLLVWWLVVENLLNAFVDPRFSRFLPFVAGNGLLAIEDDTASIETLSAALTRTEDALVFGGYAAIALTIGTVLLYRRDTN
jgi:ABC-2 type transport system permease protein